MIANWLHLPDVSEVTPPSYGLLITLVYVSSMGRLVACKPRRLHPLAVQVRELYNTFPDRPNRKKQETPTTSPKPKPTSETPIPKLCGPKALGFENLKSPFSKASQKWWPQTVCTAMLLQRCQDSWATRRGKHGGFPKSMSMGSSVGVSITSTITRMGPYWGYWFFFALEARPLAAVRGTQAAGRGPWDAGRGTGCGPRDAGRGRGPQDAGRGTRGLRAARRGPRDRGPRDAGRGPGRRSGAGCPKHPKP